MQFSRYNAALRLPARSRNMRAWLGAAMLVSGLLISADASAALYLLEKLLAPAVGTKPGMNEGKKTYDEDTLKPEELTECVVIAHRFDEREAHKPLDVEEITKRRDELNKSGALLSADIEAAKKDPITEEQAKKLNQRTNEYNAALADFNARVDTANLNVKAFNGAQRQDLNQFTELCAGKRFFKSDLDVVRPKLDFDISDILAGKKHSTPAPAPAAAPTPGTTPAPAPAATPAPPPKPTQ